MPGHMHFRAVVISLVMATAVFSTIFPGCAKSTSPSPSSSAWERRFLPGSNDAPLDINIGVDGNYLIAGYSDARLGQYEPMVARLDQFGYVQSLYFPDTIVGWSEEVSGISFCPGTSDELYVAIQYVSKIFGPAKLGLTLAKSNLDGEVIWKNKMSSIGYCDMIPSADGGCHVLALNQDIHGYQIMKIGVQGDIEWQANAPSTLCTQLIQTIDGGFVVAGFTINTVPGNDTLQIPAWHLGKVGNAGELLWKNVYDADIIYSPTDLIQTSDGGFVMIGTTVDARGVAKEILVIRTDNTGTEIWRKTLAGDIVILGNAVVENHDHNLVVLGTKRRSRNSPGYLYLCTLDMEGNVLSECTYGENVYVNGCTIALAPNGGYIIVGKVSYPSRDESDIYVIKTE